MGAAPRRDDDELPIRVHPLSNGEYAPLRRSPVVVEAVRRTFDVADVNARRTGISRRAFLRSAAGTSAFLTALAACTDEQRAASTTRATSTTDVPLGPGGTFDLPPDSAIDDEVATSVLAGREGDLIIDVQTHELLALQVALLVEVDVEPLAVGQRLLESVSVNSAATKRERLTLPLSPIVISQARHSLSSPGFNEHRPLDSDSGSIGTTRSGKYTDVPRRVASWSSADPTRT